MIKPIGKRRRRRRRKGSQDRSGVSVEYNNNPPKKFTCFVTGIEKRERERARVHHARPAMKCILLYTLIYYYNLICGKKHKSPPTDLCRFHQSTRSYD
jgi:hypothetical protein